MSERIRNALFNTLGRRVDGARVLDAFAGSGSIGLEALSRGATSAVFVEKDAIAAKLIASNIRLLNVDEITQLVKAPVNSWFNTYEGELFDLIFADPPYHDPQFSTALQLISLLKPNGLMVLSYPGRGEAPTANGVVVVDNRSYGTAALTFYRRR
jgi:16S rRNA (guanine966-N2)-methyltransferase